MKQKDKNYISYLMNNLLEEVEEVDLEVEEDLVLEVEEVDLEEEEDLDLELEVDLDLEEDLLEVIDQEEVLEEIEEEIEEENMAFHVLLLSVNEFFEVDAEQGGAVAEDRELLVEELAALRFADEVDGVAGDEEADAALVEDDLAVCQEFVGTGHGVGVDSDRSAPFPDRGDAPSGFEFPGEDPVAEVVRDLDIDGFVGVEFHNLVF